MMRRCIQPGEDLVFVVIGIVKPSLTTEIEI
jgi:hypothetical protein